MAAFTLSGLAREVGVNAETVRYYERRGLLPSPPRTSSGYRQYSDDDLWRLRFIRRAKDLGFTLAEIADLLGGEHPLSAGEVLGAAARKLDQIDDDVRRLETRREHLRRLVEICAEGDDDCVALRLT